MIEITVASVFGYTQDLWNQLWFYQVVQIKNCANQNAEYLGSELAFVWLSRGNPARYHFEHPLAPQRLSLCQRLKDKSCWEILQLKWLTEKYNGFAHCLSDRCHQGRLKHDWIERLIIE